MTTDYKQLAIDSLEYDIAYQSDQSIHTHRAIAYALLAILERLGAILEQLEDEKEDEALSSLLMRPILEQIRTPD